MQNTHDKQSMAYPDYPQADAYTAEARATHREHLRMLNTAFDKSRATKSERVRREQERLMAEQFSLLEAAHVALKPVYGNREEPQVITSFDLVPTVEEERERRAWEIDWLVGDAEDDLKRARTDLKHRASYLRDDLNRVLSDLEENPQAHVPSLGIIQGEGLEIDRLCAKIDAAERKVAQMRRLAKIARAANGTPKTEEQQ